MLNKDVRPLNCFIPAKDVYAGFHLNMKHVFNGLSIQVKDKCGVFYKSQPLIELLVIFLSVFLVFRNTFSVTFGRVTTHKNVISGRISIASWNQTNSSKS